MDINLDGDAKHMHFRADVFQGLAAWMAYDVVQTMKPRRVMAGGLASALPKPVNQIYQQMQP